MKHGSVGVTLLCIGCSIGLGSYFARGPWDEYREQQRQTELARRELRKIEDQRADLIRQTTRNSSRQGEEELLRERGHYRVDERPLYEVLDN